MMRKHWTKKEKDDLLRKLKIVIDTREKKNGHILCELESKGIPYETRKLDVGDYTLMLGDLTLESSCVIERKHGLEELAVNLGKDRERFELELLRAKAFGLHVFLMIEGSSWGDIRLRTYGKYSTLPADAIYDALADWQVNYPMTVLFCEEQDSARHIVTLLAHWAMKELDGKSER